MGQGRREGPKETEGDSLRREDAEEGRGRAQLAQCREAGRAVAAPFTFGPASHALSAPAAHGRLRTAHFARVPGYSVLVPLWLASPDSLAQKDSSLRP